MPYIVDVYAREVLDSRGNPTVEVDAPLGTMALPYAPDSVVTSTSTVGFPLESRTSLA